MIFLPYDVVRLNEKKGLYEVVSIEKHPQLNLWVTNDDCDSEIKVSSEQAILVVRNYHRKDIEQ